jgi:hypothetical protein
MAVIEGNNRGGNDRLIELDSTCYQDPKQRKWKEVLKPTEVKKALLISKDYSDRYELKTVVEPKEALAALKGAGLTKLAKALETGRSSGGSDSYAREQKRARAVAAMERKIFMEGLRQLTAANQVNKKPTFWRAIGEMTGRYTNFMGARFACEALGLEPTKGTYSKNYNAPLQKLAVSSEIAGLRVFLTVFAAGDGYQPNRRNPQLGAACRLAGIDLKKVETQVRATAKLLKEAKKKKKGKS